MTQESILAELKRIRAASHCRPVQATENDLSRLIAKLQDHEDQLEAEWRAVTMNNLKA